MSETFTFGYFAHEESTQEASERLRQWMSSRLGVPMKLQFAGGYEALAREVEAGSVDLAWLPPVVFVKVRPGAAEPLVSLLRGRAKGYQSVLVVRADSSIHRLKDLRNTRAAWVDAWSASGFVVPRVGLSSLGIDPRTLFRVEAFHGSHGAATRAVVDGAADVTGTHARLKEAGDEGVEGPWALVDGVAMRVLQSFGAVPSDLICTRPDLPAEEKKALHDAFIAAAEGPMKAEVKAIFGADAFAEGSATGYDDLRKELEKATKAGLFD